MYTLPEIQSWLTQLFHAAPGEYGQDYGIPVGRPIYSPIAGTVGTEDTGKKDWGKRLIVHAPTASAYSFAVGHLTKFAVPAGAKVKVGDLLGWSGGATSDPSSGKSSGPHVEVQFFQLPPRAGVQYVNPKDVFAKYASWESVIFNGPAAATSSSSIDSSASSGNPITDAVNAALSPVGDAIQGVASSTQKLATRAFFVMFGMSLLVLGLVLMFFGDIKSAIEAGQHTAEKAGKVAATVAAPEVAVPAEAAGAAA